MISNNANVSSKTLSKQKALLLKSSTRKIFRKLGSDSASLMVHRDAESLLSRQTDKLSKLSVVFSYDRELFSSKLYERVLRGSMKESLRRQQAGTKAMLPSQSTDHRITKDLEHSKRTSKIILLGADDSGKTTVMKQARILYGNRYSAEELEYHRDVINKNIFFSAEVINYTMEYCDIHPKQEKNQDIRKQLYTEVVYTRHKPLGPKLVELISSL